MSASKGAVHSDSKQQALLYKLLLLGLTICTIEGHDVEAVSQACTSRQCWLLSLVQWRTRGEAAAAKTRMWLLIETEQLPLWLMLLKAPLDTMAGLSKLISAAPRYIDLMAINLLGAD